MSAPSSRSVWLLASLILGAALSWWLATSTDPGAAPHGAVAPQRVVLFAPNLTETAFRLGYGDRVVGVTDFCVWPPQAQQLPRVGGMVDPNLERILALQPDLLVVQGKGEVLRTFADTHALTLAGVTMDEDLETIFSGIAQLDSILAAGQSPSRAPALLKQIRDALAEVSAAAAGRQRPRVLLVLGRDPQGLRRLFTVGSGTFLGELVEIAGGEHIFDSHDQSYFRLSLESLVADPPDVALEVRPGEAVDMDQIRADWEGAGLGSVRVEAITFDGAMIPGPRVAEVARAFLAAIHPELAADAQP